MDKNYSVIIINQTTGAKRKYGTYINIQYARIIQWSLNRHYQYKTNVLIEIKEEKDNEEVN